jgi:mitochondrial enoyl-[acyl-carrier protein] reductase / trans-2-enoyl-CoA reductase
MLAVHYRRFGPASEVAELIQLPDPAPPAAGEVLIDVEAAPINPADLLRLEGRYGDTIDALPAYAGTEGVGRIVAVGPDVDHLRPGNRVLLHQNFVKVGTWRERLVAPAAVLHPMPEADPLQLAMLSANPATAWLMLTEFITVQPGDWIVQNAANSATGHWLFKLATIRGIGTINVVRREEAAAELRDFGAEHVLIDGPDLSERIVHLLGGTRPRLAIDAIGGKATQRLAAAVADGGIVVNYGLLSGEACRVATHDTVFRDVALRGFWLQRWRTLAEPETLRGLYRMLAQMVADGALSVPIEATYPLTRVTEALAHAARPGRRGKVLLTLPSGQQ